MENTKKYKYAIFDMDGTLLDSMYIWDNMCKNYAASLNCEINQAFIDKFYTLKPLAGAEFFISEFKLDKTPEEVVNEVNSIVLSQYMNEVKPKNGVPELLEALKSKGVKMGIATLTDRVIVEAIMKKLNLLDYFTLICTSTEVGRSKKHPDIFNYCTKMLGGTIDETVIFEDSLVAATTATNEGYFVFGVADDSNITFRNKLKETATEFYETLENFPCDKYFI